MSRPIRGRILPPPSKPKYDPVTARPAPARRPLGIPLGIVPLLLAVAAFVGVLVWSLGGPQGLGRDSQVVAPRTPAPTHVEPLTKVGANGAAGALLVAWHDVDHLQFVAWDIHRVTGCVPLAVKYDGPDGHTDPRSIPDDIETDVVGRAHRGGERLKVWFGCERGTE